MKHVLAPESNMCGVAAFCTTHVANQSYAWPDLQTVEIQRPTATMKNPPWRPWQETHAPEDCP